MRKIVFFGFMIMLNTAIFGQGIGINELGNAPDPSAILDASSTNKGFLPPRLTTAQRDNIIAPAEGLFIYNTTTKCINIRSNATWLELCGTPSTGSISSLDCAGAIINGILTDGVTASGVTSEIQYTGGNGGSYSGQTVNSTGIIGLTAELTPGAFANGAGTLTYTINGTPTGSGTAEFILNIGGQTCTLNLTVDAPSFPCGTGTVTFIYNGSTVTYGTVEKDYSSLPSPYNNVGLKCWLDRNLGASQVATGSTDTNSYGDLFQWGREDDGHQITTSPTTPTLSNSDQAGHGDFILSSGNTTTAPYNDWRNPQNANLWQGANGINNPCPNGWRLPTEAELDAERASWSSNNAAGAFASVLKLPMAGYRLLSDGSLQNVGTFAFYWSSTVSGTRSLNLFFNSGDVYMNTSGRALGHSVRCIKD